MKLDQICNKQDEFYTLEYAVAPILKYVEGGKTVWCPFDTKESHFVKMLSDKGLEVKNSHIQEGVDFLVVLFQSVIILFQTHHIR